MDGWRLETVRRGIQLGRAKSSSGRLSANDDDDFVRTLYSSAGRYW